MQFPYKVKCRNKCLAALEVNSGDLRSLSTNLDVPLVKQDGSWAQWKDYVFVGSSVGRNNLSLGSLEVKLDNANDAPSSQDSFIDVVRMTPVARMPSPPASAIELVRK